VSTSWIVSGNIQMVQDFYIFRIYQQFVAGYKSVFLTVVPAIGNKKCLGSHLQSYFPYSGKWMSCSHSSELQYLFYYPATMTPCKQRKSRFSTTRSLDPEHQGTGGRDNTYRERESEKKFRGLNSTGADDDERKLGVGFLYEWSAKFRATTFFQNLTKILQNLASKISTSSKG
jgi:hypothetical protein